MHLFKVFSILWSIHALNTNSLPLSSSLRLERYVFSSEMCLKKFIRLVVLLMDMRDSQVP